MNDSSPTHIRVEQIDALLPQTQCGRCGQPGCRPYAEAVAAGEAHNLCPPGGQVTVDALARLLDRDSLPLEPGDEDARTRTVAFIREDECIGCTKCIQACPVDAIVGAARLMHTVIADECTGCDLCVAPCPVDCIDMLPAPETPYTWLGDDSAAAERAHRRADIARQRFRAREVRLQRQREEKEARRRARIEAQQAASPAAPEAGAAERQKQLRTLKTAYNMAHKQYKQARAALERAQRDGAAGLETMSAKVDALRHRAEDKRRRVDQLMNEAKAEIAAGGKDLKTLKLEAARAESALVDQQRLLDRRGREGADNGTLAGLEQELERRRQRAGEARDALRRAFQEHGLSE